MANFNNGVFFSDAFTSLLAQTFEDWEAIVIDDCSTDNSVAEIKRLIADDSRFRFYENTQNMGYQKTIARGISLSKTGIFGRLDPDDALHPHAVELSLKAHRMHTEAGLVYSNIVYCDALLKPTHINKGRHLKVEQESCFNLSGAIWPFATFKRKIYDLTSGIDPFNRRAEDQDLYLKMAERAPLKYIDHDLYLYRIHDRGASVKENTERSFYWHWVALVKMSERRNINMEDVFTEYLVDRRKLNPFKQRRGNMIHAVNTNKFLSLLARMTGKKF